MKHIAFLSAIILTSAALAQDKPAVKPAEPVKDTLGYQTTPMIPGSKWHVHDGTRPQPRVVAPGEYSTQEKVGTAPADAVVLFDGKDLSQWKSGDGEAKWKVEGGYFECVPKTGTLGTKGQWGPDVQLHIEWLAPAPVGKGQARGNSGVFFHGRYEIQVLDCFDNPTYPDGQATAVYGQTPPLVNATRPPLTWNTYDIVFNGPRFDAEGKVLKPAYVTIFHNGVLTQNHTELTGSTPHQGVGKYTKHGEKTDITLQDHGNTMRFRNVWIREMKPTGE